MSDFIRALPLISQLEPFLIATPMNRRPMDKKPYGIEVPSRTLVDPTRMDHEPFLALLQTLDARTFGPEGMPMARWVLYDCCYMPAS